MPSFSSLSFPKLLSWVAVKMFLLATSLPSESLALLVTRKWKFHSLKTDLQKGGYKENPRISGEIKQWQ